MVFNNLVLLSVYQYEVIFFLARTENIHFFFLFYKKKTTPEPKTQHDKCCIQQDIQHT